MSQTQSAALVLASTAVAQRIGMEKGTMLETFKAQCFRNANNVSDSQLAAFVSIANEMGVNPLLPGMLYAYPTTGGGIVPMMGPDGVYKKLMEHPSVASWKTKVYPEDANVPPTHAETIIYLKGAAGAEGEPRTIEYTAYFNEWKVGSNPNWNARPRHMLGLRSLKQAARQVIHGLPYDEDDKTIGDLINVTPAADTAAGSAAPERPPAKERSKRGVASVAENPAKTDTPATDTKGGTSAPVIDVPATVVETPANPPAAEKPVEQARPTETVKQDVKPAAQVTNSTPAVVQLEDGKEVTVEGLSVERFIKKPINGIENSIEAEVKGAFTGKVYHLGGAGPAWQIENPVTLRILGKKLKSGAIAGMVQSIELTPAPAGGETLE